MTELPCEYVGTYTVEGCCCVDACCEIDCILEPVLSDECCCIEGELLKPQKPREPGRKYVFQ